MPNIKRRSNNKKKKGGRGATDRAANPANRAERLRASGPTAAAAPVQFERLPSFPGPETREQELNRFLGYKHLSTPDDNYRDVKLARGENGSVLMEATSNATQAVESCEFTLEDWSVVKRKLSIDYDRDAAEYPVARKLMMDQPPIDVARHAKKRIEDVPKEEIDVFLAFLEGGEAVRVDCRRRDELNALVYNVTLKGAKYTGDNVQALHFLVNRGGYHNISYSGCLRNACPQKYHKELTTFLAHECMHQISSGTAFLNKEVDVEECVDLIAMSLRQMYTDKERWANFVHLYMSLLDWAITRKYSLWKIACIENTLGMALGSRHLHSQAALVYAEAGNHLLRAEHPGTYFSMQNAALAWDDDGDHAKAETYFAIALHSLRFERDPDKYRRSVFEVLRHIFVFYLASPGNAKLKATLHAVISAAGEDLEITMVVAAEGSSNAHILRDEYRRGTPDEMCRVVQSIVLRSTSAEKMKEAILECADPKTYLIGSLDDGAILFSDTREQIRNCCPSGKFVLSCGSCGSVKKESSLRMCPCKKVSYCNPTCQKNHWPQHKAECTAGRGATKKTKKASK